MTSRRLLDPIVRTLLDAADEIDRVGWCKDTSRDIFGRVCASKAISIAGQTRAEKNDARAKLRFHLGVESISAWNDHCDTQDEVTAAMRAAALAVGD